YVALRYLPLTELTAINFASPLIVTLLVGPFLGEKIGPRRVIAVIIGFIGVLIVTRPGGHGIHVAALLALVGSLTNAFYSIATRKLVGHDSPETTMFYTGMVGSVALAPVLFFVWSTPNSLLTWAVMLLIGALGAIAHWLLILAHKHSPASVLAPFYYAQLIGAAIIAMIVFGEFPDIWTILGGSIVIGSGLYVLYRERVRKREAEILSQN
ncbi:MAG: DMT family transporter, partial [Puniceicoccales bacterium]|nr:DMT family transporter [Puniceicoccales bacterium]